jgi:hypothetical protein
MDYENKSDWTLGENKPNSNPNKPNLLKAKMNVNSFIKKDYRKNDAFAVQKNKPNSNPIKANFRSLPEADKIALKIYPFGIDCPIVLRRL